MTGSDCRHPNAVTECRKPLRQRMYRRMGKLFALVWVLAGYPALSFAGPVIPGFYGAVPDRPSIAPNVLPVVKNVVQGASVPGASNDRLVVHQDQPQAIIEWDSFNIGEEASTYFDQQGNKGWTALNRIFDRNPSQISGRLAADGKVYLINQNGILFGPSAKVNVHSLAASSLNISDEDFINKVLKFSAESYIPGADLETDAAVSNHGVIETDDSGLVLLLAPTVENSGAIITPCGQVGLVAGTEIEMSYNASGDLVFDVLNTGEFGRAANFENGRLIADTGLAGMYGKMVNQEGLIRSVTAVKQNGKIELLASDKISTGAESLTICPVSDSPETVHESFGFKGGQVKLAGLNTHAPVKCIEHRGVIDAPSGTIGLEAEERVYLEKESRIDASGMWIEKSADANLIEAQLNSVQLRDDYGQKEGPLKGETITVNALNGSAIGDISGHLVSEEMTALERSTKGGAVNIAVSSGDIIVKEGAEIDFSGGGIRYGDGHFETTKLLSGNRIYDISEAPQWLQYDKVLGVQEKRHERYGIVEEFAGIYYGGAAPLSDYCSSHTEGSDAGSLSLIAGCIALDGQIRGSVEAGIFQTEASEPQDEYGNQSARGRKEPKGGTLIIGRPQDERLLKEYKDHVLGEIVVTSEVASLPESFGPDPADFPYPEEREGRTYLSAEKLNAAGLSSLSLWTNTKLTTEENARISLRSGGSFEATARSIEHRGKISAPAGSIGLTIWDNITSDSTKTESYVPVRERIYLAEESVIEAGGEKIDNSLSEEGTEEIIRSGHIGGGTVSIMDRTEHGDGVLVKQDAVIDVSGGYEIDESGNVSGGDAGTLKLQGSTLALEGELKGHSLIGSKGGTIILHAGEVAVKHSAPSLPDDFTFESNLPEEQELKNRLVLAENQLDQTGFSQIELKSFHNLTIEEGTTLTPSRAKSAAPVPGKSNDNTVEQASDEVAEEDGLISVAPEYLGSSSIKIRAGKALDIPEGGGASDGTEMLTLACGASIEVAPGGEIEVEAPGIMLAGTLEAPSGKVKATAKEDQGLTLAGSAQILAEGYNQPGSEPPAEGLPAEFTPLPGGEVALEAKNGDLILESGSLIDVSGSVPATSFIRNPDGSLSSASAAGDPGSIRLIYLNDAVFNGELNGRAQMEGVRGGSLTVSKTDENVGEEHWMNLSSEEMNRYLEAGFDDLTFVSRNALCFSDSVDLDIKRSLTLDAPEISGSGENRIRLSAPWLKLVNSYWPSQAQEGNAQLTLSSEWIDINGSIAMSGFSEVAVEALQDLRLSDRYYTPPAGGNSKWAGALETPGNLILKAARIYPTTWSDFTIKSGAKFTTLPGGAPTGDPVFSAGGSLTIKAKVVEHGGVLAAPMGKIAIEGEQRVYLAENSVVTTKGESSVNYGTLSETFWTMEDKENPSATTGIPVEDAPEKAVSIAGDEIIARQGSVIDTSGGGSVFSYLFLEGIEGSENPLERTGTYVIKQGASLPGKAVYLEGTNDLAGGAYSLLPESCAFLPDAFVITDLGEVSSLENNVLSEEGYTVVLGYTTVAGTDVRSSKPHAYALRSATDVLKEGDFKFQELEAGKGGGVEISGPTVVLDGVIKGEASPGYQGGILSVSAAENAFVRSSIALPQEFEPTDDIPVNLLGKCLVSSEGLSGRGLEELNIGDLDITSTITLADEGILEASIVNLSAKNSIILEPGTQIQAVGEGGTASFITPEGEVVIRENALVHASDEVSLDCSSLDLEGQMKVDHSSLNLCGDRIFIVPDGYAEEESDGLYLCESLRGLEGFDRIGLLSRSDLVFLGDVGLEVQEELTIDAARIAGDLEEENAVTVSSPRINLLNSGDTSADTALEDKGFIAFDAEEIAVGHGDVLFDGFSKIDFNSRDDLTLKGEGSLTVGGDLKVAAGRLTTSFYQDSETPYEVADFQVNAGGGAVTIQNSGEVPDKTGIPGGRLEILARTIDHSGIVDVTAGQVMLTSSGSETDEGIFLRSGSRVLARGRDDAPGGLVDLRAENGVLSIEAGSLIDVSAGSRKEAGTVFLQAPVQGVRLEGNLMGEAQEGKGGSFVLDTDRLDDFCTLNAKLADGGFNESLDLRARSGDIAVAPDETVHAHHFKLAVDAGDVDLHGTIDASAEEGGTVELHAGSDLTIHNGGGITACGTGTASSGGQVLLSAAAGTLNLELGGSVDVSGGQSGQGGEVTFRSLRNDVGDDVKMDLAGSIRGASRIVAEAAKVYQDSSISGSDINNWKNDIQTFMTDHSETIRTRLLAGLTFEECSADEFHLLPGIEIQSPGDLSLSSIWDLSGWRYGGEPGVLTLRAAEDLNVNSDLVDHPTPFYNLQKSPELDSWSLNLVAGADLGGADVMTTKRETGDLQIKNEKLVYTESAPLLFASGRDVLVGTGRQAGYMINSGMKYNLGTYDGTIRGKVGGDLSLQQGAIQTATGNIDITVGRDLELGSKGAIRTTGYREVGASESPYSVIWYLWEYADGGDINLDVKGAIEGSLNARAWDDSFYGNFWIARYNEAGDSKTTTGLATMGGGDLSVRTGGDFAAQIGTFGQQEESDLSVCSGGNIDGRFLVRQGQGELHAMGNFGMDPENLFHSDPLERPNETIEAFDARIDVIAQGSIEIGAILNPAMAGPDPPNDMLKSLQYSEDTKVKLKAVMGDVSLWGQSRPYGQNSIDTDKYQRILPATLEIEAGGDINLENQFVMAPSPTGNLRLLAGGDINGLYTDANGFVRTSSILLSDRAPEDVYGNWNDLGMDWNTLSSSSAERIHLEDPDPVEIKAGRDIRNLSLFLPQKAEIAAGRDIRDIYYRGQNLAGEDVATLRAERDIFFSTAESTYQTGVEYAGPGFFVVQAGNSLDLGTTKGIQTIGNLYNAELGSEGCSLIVVSGFNKGLGTDEVETFFAQLRSAGADYSRLLEQDPDSATQCVEEARENIIEPLLEGSPAGEGNIDMIKSQIMALGSDSDIFIMARGKLNVGRSTFATEADKENTGITTEAGGGINVFADGDVNVLESRMMTKCGGDITVWSDHGDINAGRGSKTAINMGKPTKVWREDHWEIYRKPVAVGSGIRTLTYDPDGFEGPLTPPPAGDVYLFAPQGVIDAGEAGISGKNVLLGATQVLNTQNISFSQGAVGVPVASEGNAGMGALAGAGSLTEMSRMTEENSGLGPRKVPKATQVVDDFMAQWLDVKVIGFDMESEEYELDNDGYEE